jgi:hypothetical protein
MSRDQWNIPPATLGLAELIDLIADARDRSTSLGPVSVMTTNFDRPPGLEFRKPHGAQSPKRFAPSSGSFGTHLLSVEPTVGISKHKARGSASFDHELPPMHGAVMCGADHDQPVGIMVAAFGARPQMMDVHEGRMAATPDRTASIVAPHDQVTYGRRHVLRRVGRAQSGLRVAFDATSGIHVTHTPACVATNASW